MSNKKKEEIALFRFGVIFALLECRDSCLSLRKRAGQLAEKDYDIPYSKKKTISASTILSWYYLYIKNRNLSDLMPKSRKDKSVCRSVDLEAANELVRRHLDRPEVPLTTIVRQMAKEGLDIKMHSAYRVLANAIDSSENKDEKNQRRFEMEHCNDMWILDAMVGPKVVVQYPSGKKLVSAHCFAFMDDRSRLITHAQFYLNERTESLLDCLYSALGKRGLPVRIYTDNGSAMRDFRLKYGLASLEVQLTYATAYHPQGKAKLERFWKTLRMQLLSTLDTDLTLYDLNRELAKWINDYNNRYHSAISMSPFERYMTDIEAVRPAPDKIAHLFRVREERVVSSSRTVSFHNKLLEVPIGYGGKTIELRYSSIDGDIEGFFNGQSIGFLTPVDLVHNSTIYRRASNGK